LTEEIEMNLKLMENRLMHVVEDKLSKTI